MRHRCAPLALVVALGTLGAPAAARAADPDPAAPKKSLWKKIRAGHDLLETAPTALVFDAMWSFAVNVGTALTNRTWDAPYPWGTIGQYSTRLLYGTGWMLMLGVESLAVVAATGGTFDWFDEASYRSEWVVLYDAPICPRSGAYGGCGVGVGDFAFVQAKLRRSAWWVEAGGGWIQQRVYNDPFRTAAESSWVLSPLTMLYEARTRLDAPVAVRAFAGPGLFFGLHAGHMHPTLRGQRERGLDAPWHEMYALDAGIGPGVRGELRVIFLRHLTLEGELTIAPFLAGGPTGSRPSGDIAPLDFEREGMTVWRKAMAGVAWDDPEHVPFKTTAAFVAAELSERPTDRIGHHGVMLRFDFPLRAPGGIR